MAASRFEIDWPTVQLLLITVLAFAIGLAGCGPLADSMALPQSASVPAELVPFQGKWKLDESRSAEANSTEFAEADLSAEDKAFFDAMQKLGGSGSEFSCLENLWGKESGWNPNAQNPTSTAYGIPQFLDSTWAGTGIAKTSDGYRQIDAGLIYIEQRYGSREYVTFFLTAVVFAGVIWIVGEYIAWG